MILNKVDNVSTDTWFTRLGVNRQRETRLSTDPNNLAQPRSRLEIRKKFFSCRTVNRWNNLPPEVKYARNVFSFKKLYKKIISPQPQQT